MIHMMEIEATVAGAGATIRILDLNCDIATPDGRLTFNLFASVATFEREQMLERQAVGISAAKAEGEYEGRAPTANAKSGKVLELASKGLTKQEIADATGMGIGSVYRILKAA
jgi:DNA invertase Pin-like site-specific DNA recombinase